MQAAQGQLTILNAHQPKPQVYWNGVLVSGVRVVTVNNDPNHNFTRVAITVQEDLVLAEMAAAGIVIKREAA